MKCVFFLFYIICDLPTFSDSLSLCLSISLSVSLTVTISLQNKYCRATTRGDNGTCVPWSYLGDTCTRYRCFGNLMFCDNQTCKQRLKLGSNCPRTSIFEVSNCEDGLHCDATRTCVPVDTALLGIPCNLMSDDCNAYDTGLKCGCVSSSRLVTICMHCGLVCTCNCFYLTVRRPTFGFLVPKLIICL